MADASKLLANQVAIFTGASSGIGTAVAKAPAAGAVNYSSDAEGADTVVQAIEAAGGRA